MRSNTVKDNLDHEPLKLPGRKTCSKNFETPFFQDIQSSFNGEVDIVLKPHQKIFFENISTNMVARGVGSFGTLGGAADPLIYQCQKKFGQSSTDM